MNPADSARPPIGSFDGTTGNYVGFPTTDEILDIAAAVPREGPHSDQLKSCAARDREGKVAARYDIDTRRLDQTGWGVIFSKDEDHAVLEALEPLLTHRKAQATKGQKEKEHFFRRFIDGDGYQPGEATHVFQQRHGVLGATTADPDLGMPYYLLIVGDPQCVPFRFQYEMDVVYAVGRLHFRKVEDYRAYADRVVRWETGPQSQPNLAAFFGTLNTGDEDATLLSSTHLVSPLAMKIKSRFPSWRIEPIIGSQATKKKLTELLQHEPPSFLFTATHGVAFPYGAGQQLSDQGALLCSDDPATQWQNWYFAANSVTSGTALPGSITFHFACYSAGTPDLSDFPNEQIGQFPEIPIAPHPFIAALPTRLLSLPQGALAVIGHIDKTWTYSFMLPRDQGWIAAFEETIRRILGGFPVGAAMEPFNQRYAACSDLLFNSLILAKQRNGIALTPAEKSSTLELWSMRNDARNYVILGDPAVRLGVKPSNAMAALPNGQQ